MPEAMTKERLEELQALAYDAVDTDAQWPYGEALSEACSEIERLLAVNEFLQGTTVCRGGGEDVCRSDCYWAPDELEAQSKN